MKNREMLTRFWAVNEYPITSVVELYFHSEKNDNWFKATLSHDLFIPVVLHYPLFISVFQYEIQVSANTNKWVVDNTTGNFSSPAGFDDNL